MPQPPSLHDQITRVTQYLHSLNLRMTPQRQCIMEVFLHGEGHRTIESVLAAVHKTDASIGQATVYRTMKILCEAQIAREVQFGDGVARYEYLHEQHHDHLICERCGLTMETVDFDIERLQEELARKHGFIPTTHRLTLYGICSKCQTAKPVIRG